MFVYQSYHFISAQKYKFKYTAAYKSKVNKLIRNRKQLYNLTFKVTSFSSSLNLSTNGGHTWCTRGKSTSENNQEQYEKFSQMKSCLFRCIPSYLLLPSFLQEPLKFTMLRPSIFFIALLSNIYETSYEFKVIKQDSRSHDILLLA